LFVLNQHVPHPFSYVERLREEQQFSRQMELLLAFRHARCGKSAVQPFPSHHFSLKRKAHDGKRKYALSILKQARTLLTNRLIESIAESAEGILEDAEGCSYMEEIEALQEKIGGRLNSINRMIANFPVNNPSDQEQALASQSTPPSVENPVNAGTRPPEKFALFSQQIAANELAAAGKTLAELLDVDQFTGIQCAEFFQKRINEDPAILEKAMLLRAKLTAGENNDSLMLLWDCFRLQGLQAVEVLQTLKSNLSTA